MSKKWPFGVFFPVFQALGSAHELIIPCCSPTSHVVLRVSGWQIQSPKGHRLGVLFATAALTDYTFAA